MSAIKTLADTRALRALEKPRQETSSMISSREEHRFKFERALSFEIERTLSTVSGVLEARVHLNPAPADPLFGQPLSKTPGSGSVLLVTGAGFAKDSTEIARLVGGASGIEPSRISVLINSTAPEAVSIGTIGTSSTVRPFTAMETADQFRPMQGRTADTSWRDYVRADAGVALMLIGATLLVATRIREWRRRANHVV